MLAAAPMALAQPADGGADKKTEPAAEKKPAITLKVGDLAPPLAVEKFVKGEPVTGFEKGRVYVMEFWATWCGPCIAAMPHLSELQKEFKDKGVTVIGVNVWEDKEFTADTLKGVEEFVTAKGDGMAYTVAYDGAARKMDEGYMKAAGMNGIPSSFLVDKDGKIAWIGHPMWMDTPLEEVVNGTWDPVKGPEKIKAAQKSLSDIRKTMRDDPKAALATFEQFEKDYPKIAYNYEDMKTTLLLQSGRIEEAYKGLGKQVDKAIAAKDHMKLNEIAWSIVDPEADVKNKDLELAMRAAQKATEFTESKDGAILDTLARVYFLKGDVAKAIELQEKAVEAAPEGMKEQLQPALDEYKAAKKG
jgi:thiol-disulfide isomerase/thioredoxin